MIPLITQHSDEIAEICQRHHVKRQALFGSAAASDFNPQTSNLDFLVDYHTFPRSGKAEAYFGLPENQQHLFDRRIDVVVERATDNQCFQISVDETQRQIYPR